MPAAIISPFIRAFLRPFKYQIDQDYQKAFFVREKYVSGARMGFERHMQTGILHGKYKLPAKMQFHTAKYRCATKA